MASQEVSKQNFTGRASQKDRTRNALVDAAQDLIRKGRGLTISDVAEAAGISRATAYRYFPTQEILLAEVALFSVDGPLFPAKSAGRSVPEAVGHLVRRVAVWAYQNEQPLRTILRLSLDPATGVRRPGHRSEWIADVLAPVRKQMQPEAYSRLAKALTLMLGIDPIVVMTDIAGATREQALDTLQWSARTLVESALLPPSNNSRRKLRKRR